MGQTTEIRNTVEKHGKVSFKNFVAVFEKYII